MTDIEKRRRVLRGLEARDTSAMGFQAQIRHSRRIAEARRAYEEAVTAAEARPSRGEPADIASV